MNNQLKEYLAKEKVNYDRGLVTKVDVLMWIALYTSINDELREAKQQVEAW